MKFTLRATLKGAIAAFLYYSGLLWLYAAVRLRHRAIVLMYHRVLPAEADTFSQDGIVVQPQTFARHMSFLQRYFHPLSVEQLASHLERRAPLPSMSCVVTFDDGWADNFEHALPALQRLPIPATVFLATDFIGSDACFWQERLARRLFEAARQGGAARALVQRRVELPVDRMCVGDLRQAVLTTVAGMKDWKPTDVAMLDEELGAVLATDAGSASGTDRFMSWDQVTLLTRQSCTTIGAHGCSHSPLTSISKERAATELRESRARIAASTGCQVLAIAYPNGSFDDSVVQQARQAGYRLGFTTRRGYVSAADDRFRLRRINIHESATATIPEFMCTLLGVFRRYQPADGDACTRNGR